VPASRRKTLLVSCQGPICVYLCSSVAVHPWPVPNRLSSFTFDRLIVVLVFLTIALACGLTPMHTDSWWQLRAGRDMWQTHRILVTDLYSHTAYGTFWLNHEWLAEVSYYAMFRMGGLPLVTLFATSLILCAWGLSWRLGNGSVRERAIWIGLAVISSSFWWQPRPHAFSLLFIATTVTLVATWRVWWLPLVFLVWANCHGGVLLGFVFLGAGLGAQTLLAPQKLRTSVVVLLACLAATTVTPFGLSFWVEIPKSLARIRQYPFEEWRRPSLAAPNLVPFWFIAVAFCYGLVRSRHRLRRLPPGEATLYACALALLPLAVSAVRNVGPFLMVAAPAMTTLLPLRRSPEPAPRHERAHVNAAIAAIAVAGVAVTLAWAYANRIPKLRWDPIPAGAIAALRQCPDNLYNRYDQGGYLLWLVPERRVYLDGRQDPYPPALILEQIRLENGSGAYPEVFSRFDIHCAYLPTVSPTVAQLDRAGWTVTYRDADWVVFKN